MLYLRLHLPNGQTWDQFGVAYADSATMQRTFELVGPYLPEGTEAEPIEKECLQEDDTSISQQ